jgi:magnesium chelatase family protein
LPVRAKSWRNWKRASQNWKSTKSKTDRVAVAVVKSRALAGMDAPEVVVEAHLANGLPAFTLVGLPETEVKEARDRVRAAIQNARFEFPARRITINLAPADLPKESGRFDLPIAIGDPRRLRTDPCQDKLKLGYEFIGELALTGELRRGARHRWRWHWPRGKRGGS